MDAASSMLGRIPAKAGKWLGVRPVLDPERVNESRHGGLLRIAFALTWPVTSPIHAVETSGRTTVLGDLGRGCVCALERLE
jgi:hypothetical protein